MIIVEFLSYIVFYCLLVFSLQLRELYTGLISALMLLDFTLLPQSVTSSESKLRTVCMYIIYNYSVLCIISYLWGRILLSGIIYYIQDKKGNTRRVWIKYDISQYPWRHPQYLRMNQWSLPVKGVAFPLSPAGSGQQVRLRGIGDDFYGDILWTIIHVVST